MIRTDSTIGVPTSTVDSVISTRDSSMELTSDQITSNMDSRLAQDVREVRPNFPFIGDIDPAGNIVNNKQEDPSVESTSDQTTSTVHSRMAPNYGGWRSNNPLIGDIIPGDLLNNIQGVLFPKDANKPAQDET
ncbi:uncharacterized protein LOC111114107 isoform X2 [Crassostrea virginica]